MSVNNKYVEIGSLSFYDAKIMSKNLPFRVNTIGDFCMLLGAIVCSDRHSIPIDKILSAKYSSDLPSTESPNIMPELAEPMKACCGGGSVR